MEHNYYCINEYHKYLTYFKNKKVEYRRKLVDESANIIGKTLTKDNLFFISAIKKSIDLLDGLENQIISRNITVSGIITRVLIDTIFRVFGAYIANNRNEYIDCFIKGNRVDKLKDNKNKKMSDFRLRERIKEYNSKIPEIYHHASGYVHLSDKAFYSTVSTNKEKEYRLEINVGNELDERYNEYLVEIAEALFYCLDFLFTLLSHVSDSKKRLENKLDLNKEYIDKKSSNL